MSDGDTEMYEYEAQNNTHVMVYGDFSAQVRAVLPDYVADDSLSVAVVTLFQEMPFALYLGQGGAENLEVGEIYKFEIEDTEIFGESLEYLEYIEPNWFLAKHNIRIKNVSPADPETEWGLICNRLSYRPMD